MFVEASVLLRYHL